MQRWELPIVLLSLTMDVALASCSTVDRQDRSSRDAVVQQGSSQSQTDAQQPFPNPWPGPNVGSPIPLTRTAEQGSGDGFARNGVAGATGSQATNGQNHAPNQARRVDVDLNRVRGDIARKLHVDANKVPVTLELPVTVAADLCGVAVNMLGAQRQPNGGKPNCLANNAERATDVVEPLIQ